MSPLRFTWWLLLGSLILSAPVGAAPALPGDVIADLNALQQQLQEGDREAVSQRARRQAERLAGGNSADRWARVLYLQLAAGAEARQERADVAADLLYQARETQGIEPQQRDRWLREEAGLRLASGQTEQGVVLLEEWFASNAGQARDRWRMARALARLERWQESADWVTRALEETPAPDVDQQSLAATVYQRSGRAGEALAQLEAQLDETSSEQDWRRVAALAQRVGEPGQAAAIWEAGWRLGVLTGEEALITLVRLHLAGGTPARGAERIERAIEEGIVTESDEHVRLLAQAWQAARDRQRALGVWRRVAERSDAAQDWLQLGHLALDWGETELAEQALRRASERGSEEAQRWLTESGASRGALQGES
ncbi:MULTISPECIES: hypothetical protein [Halomonadaceae]|uniref:hypothetical protein n=1 Tax=Halomonadaceae TaxID=28256 RepID=UPI001599BC06|nr:MULTISPECIES: hypothetical protein [Halomonas]QJQ94734.1 hypothetical protein HIO72_05160 [Halomonas sp. PA5]